MSTDQASVFFATLILQVIHQKYRISYDEITNDLCPVSLLFVCKVLGCVTDLVY